jgi:hypothetical protein
MDGFSVQITPVEPNLSSLIDRFPSASQIALVHDAEVKLRVALKMWQTGRKDAATSLIVDACVCLYDLADVLSQS